jgi:hypothetical protein
MPLHVDVHDAGEPLAARPDVLMFRSRRVMAAGLLASCAPLILLVFNLDWIFTPEGSLDPWHYVGFFLAYLNPDYSPGAYKIMRLPWILAGFVTNRLLPPVPAAVVLHSLFLVITSAALFAGVYVLFRRISLAAVVAIALGFYTHGHGSGGWDYHNTAAGAFYLLVFMVLAMPAATAGRPVAMAIAGALAALAVHSNITVINLLPALAIVYAQTVRTRHPELAIVRAIVIGAAWALLGGVLITAMLGFINWMVGREFLFFAVLVDVAKRYVVDPRYQAGWYHPWSWDWLLTSKHLAVPAAVLVAATVVLARYRRSSSPADRLAYALALQFVLMVLVWAGWQTQGQTALDWDYFAYPLIPSCFVAVAGLLSFGWPDVIERHWLATTLGMAIACGSALVGALDPFIRTTRAWVEPAPVAVGCGFLAAALVFYRLRPRVSTTILVLVVFAVANRFVGVGQSSYLSTDRCQLQSGIYGAIVEGMSYLGGLDPSYSRVRTWFDEHERIEPVAGCPVGVGNIAGSMTAATFVQYVAGPWPMPAAEKVPDAALQAVANDSGILAIVASRSDALATWQRRLERAGITYKEVGRHRVPLLTSGFTIYAEELAPKVPPGIAFGSPVLSITSQTSPQINVYGTPKGHLNIEGDAARFLPTDTRDHIAYPFVDLSRRAENVWAQLTVEFPAWAANPPSCRLILQQEGFTSLAATPCVSGTRHITIPPSTSALRVNLTDQRRRSFVLPRKIELALATPAH